MQFAKEEVRSYFLLPAGDEIYVFIQKQTANSGVIRSQQLSQYKNKLHNVQHENPLNQKSGFCVLFIRRNPYLFFGFPFGPCIHPLIFFLQHVNKGPANTLNQFLHLQKIPKETVQKKLQARFSGPQEIVQCETWRERDSFQLDSMLWQHFFSQEKAAPTLPPPPPPPLENN